MIGMQAPPKNAPVYLSAVHISYSLCQFLCSFSWLDKTCEAI